MLEFVMFVSTICMNNIIYAHVAKMNPSGAIVSNYYMPISKDCKKTKVLGIIESRGTKKKD